VRAVFEDQASVATRTGDGGGFRITLARYGAVVGAVFLDKGATLVAQVVKPTGRISTLVLSHHSTTPFSPHGVRVGAWSKVSFWDQGLAAG
jgi:hypothetical protein